MDVTYTGCKASDLLGATPRAVLHLTVARSARVLDWLTSQSLSGRAWPDIVADFDDRVGTTGLVFALGSGYAPTGDSVGVLDVRVNDTLAIYATTVAQLVGRLNDLSAFCEVTAVELIPEVPGFSEGGPGELTSEDVDLQTAAQDLANAQPNIIERTAAGIGHAGAAAGAAVGDTVGALLKPVAIAIAIPLAIVAVIFIFAPKEVKALAGGGE